MLPFVSAQTPLTKKKVVPKSNKAAVVHPAPAPVKSKAGAAKTSAAKRVPSRSLAKAGTKTQRAVARRPPLQMQPSTDRYKEIQQALADKGYFHGAPDGTWNGESVEALKRFQKDQNLDPDGKIGSLTLMGLGLGPKRGIASAQSAPTGSERADPPLGAQPQP